MYIYNMFTKNVKRKQRIHTARPQLQCSMLSGEKKKFKI